MLTDDEIDAMRETVASALPATCTVTRASTDRTFNPADGTYTLGDPTTVYTGACRVRTLNTQGMTSPVGGLHETIGRYTVVLGHDADGVEVDDFVTVTAGTDAELVGRPLRVIDVRWSEWQLDRHLIVEDLQQPRVVEEV